MNLFRITGRYLRSLSQPFDSKGSISQALLISATSSGITVLCFFWQAAGRGSILGYFSGLDLLRISLFAVLGLLALGFSLRKKERRGDETGRSTFGRQLFSWDWLVVVVLTLLILVLVFVSPLLENFEPSIPHTWVLVQLLLLSGIFLQGALSKKITYLESLGVYAIVVGALIKVVSFMPAISTYPFTLDWSEGSFLYNASLFFSEKVYGVSAPLPVLHPSRALLQSLPYIISSLPLWVHRLWQVLLWLGLTAAGAAGLARHLAIRGWRLRILFVLWAFLFFFQGPIYYHLMVCAVIVFFGYNRQRFWQTLTTVLIASLWAGISRVNWLPVPGFLAAALYLLETPVGNKPVARYLMPPATWVITGFLAALASQGVYIAISGNPPVLFVSSFTSPLIWDRMFPTVTYPLGIIPGLIWITFPIAWIIIARLLGSPGAWNTWRLSGLGSILAVLLVGGLIVSVKIGGGNNEHNLDAYLLILVSIASFLYFDRFLPDSAERMQKIKVPTMVMAFLLVIPFTQTFISPMKLAWPDTAKGMQDVQKMQSLIDAYKTKPGSILLLDNRQLLAFHYLKGVTLNPNYEMDFLMEMAMSSNVNYFKPFNQSLKNHKFSLIFTHILNSMIENESHPFNAENNAWVAYIATPILKNYVRIATFPGAGIEVLAPKK